MNIQLINEFIKDNIINNIKEIGEDKVEYKGNIFKY